MTIDVMASQQETARSLVDELLAQVHRVDFNQFIRCLQIEHGSRISDAVSPDEQPVQLIADLEGSFPTNQVVAWTPPDDRHVRPRLAAAFFGLYGPSGALPEHYTHLMLERTRQGDHSLREFLDIFNHRLLTLFYQAWEKHSLPVAFETAAVAGYVDPVHAALQALVQTRLPAARDRLSLSDDWLIYYGGIMANSRCPAESLRACVEDFTALPTALEQLVGQWLQLDTADQSRLKTSEFGVSSGNMLGVDTIIGGSVWDVESRFRLQIGPVDWPTMSEYLPDSLPLRRVFDLVRRLAGPHFDFDAQVLLAADEVRGVQLGDDSYRLGHNTWLGQWPHRHPAIDAIFQPKTPPSPFFE